MRAPSIRKCSILSLGPRKAYLSLEFMRLTNIMFFITLIKYLVEFWPLQSKFREKSMDTSKPKTIKIMSLDRITRFSKFQYQHRTTRSLQLMTSSRKIWKSSPKLLSLVVPRRFHQSYLKVLKLDKTLTKIKIRKVFNNLIKELFLGKQILEWEHLKLSIWKLSIKTIRKSILWEILYPLTIDRLRRIPWRKRVIATWAGSHQRAKREITQSSLEFKLINKK